MREILILSLLSASVCMADIFAFRDLRGFEKCMLQDHLLDVVNTAEGAQKRFLSQVEVQQRCISTATKLLKSEKDKKKLVEFVKTTKRNTAHENSLDLIHLLVNLDRSSCNDMEIYEVLTKALSHPKEYPSAANSYFEDAKVVIKTCLRDSDFKKDFLEEKDSTNSYVSSNACAIMLEEKLVKECKKG